MHPRLAAASAAAILASVFALSGCEAVAISLVSAGASTIFRHNLLEGVTYRTFTASSPMVLGASLVALERMGMRVQSHARLEAGDLIVASSDNRNIELEVEPVSAGATRVRIAARNGSPFLDTATANEIISQTERVLESAANYRSWSPGVNKI